MKIGYTRRPSFKCACPQIFRANSFSNTAANAAVPMTLGPRVAPGMTLVWVQTRASASVLTPADANTVTLGWLQRLSSGSGSNFTATIFSKKIIQADIDFGSVLLDHNNNKCAAWFLLWGANDIRLSLSPSSNAATATSGFVRSAAISANTVASANVALTKPSLVVNVMIRGGGTSGSFRTTTAPSGYSMLTSMENGNSLSQDQIAVATKYQARGSTGNTAWVTSGTGDMTMESFLILASR